MASRNVNRPRPSANSDLNRKQGKKPLPEPTHVGHFVSILIITLCKKTLHIDTAVKIGVYLCGVLIGSVFSDVFALPKSYFSDKKNFMNRIFVNFGFGWTFVLLFAYIFLTSFVYCCGDWKKVLQKHVSRLVFTALWWYSMTKFFNYIDSMIGVCSASVYSRKYDCVKAGKAWLGLDISGHVFLLIHNLLTISEEVKSFKAWTQLGLLLKEEDLTSKKNLPERDISQARVSYMALTPYIKVLIVLLALWTVFCEFMLIISVVYRFHTMTQKIAAAILAVGCWFITYHVILKTDADLVPSKPGHSILNYMKLK